MGTISTDYCNEASDQINSSYSFQASKLTEKLELNLFYAAGSCCSSSVCLYEIFLRDGLHHSLEPLFQIPLIRRENKSEPASFLTPELRAARQEKLVCQKLLHDFFRSFVWKLRRLRDAVREFKSFQLLTCQFCTCFGLL